MMIFPGLWRGMCMLINKNLIVVDLDTNDKYDAINKLIALVEKEKKVESKDKFMECVLQREKEFSTGIGSGIAIPHGKSDTVREAIIAFAKLKKPIEWGAIDSGTVDLLFLLGVPENNKDNLHLRILAQLSRKLMDEEFVKLLRNSDTVQKVYDVLRCIEQPEIMS